MVILWQETLRILDFTFCGLPGLWWNLFNAALVLCVCNEINTCSLISSMFIFFIMTCNIFDNNILSLILLGYILMYLFWERGKRTWGGQRSVLAFNHVGPGIEPGYLRLLPGASTCLATSSAPPLSFPYTHLPPFLLPNPPVRPPFAFIRW